MSNVLQKAIKHAGGVSALAKLLTEYAATTDEFEDVVISHELVNMWTKRGVPANRCRLVEGALNGLITVYEMRPEVFGRGPSNEMNVG